MSTVCHSVALTSCWPVAADDVAARGKTQSLWTDSLAFLFIQFAREFQWEGKADALKASYRMWKGENWPDFHLELFHCGVCYISLIFCFDSLFFSFALLYPSSPDVDPPAVALAAGIAFCRHLSWHAPPVRSLGRYCLTGIEQLLLLPLINIAGFCRLGPDIVRILLCF